MGLRKQSHKAVWGMRNRSRPSCPKTTLLRRNAEREQSDQTTTSRRKREKQLSSGRLGSRENKRRGGKTRKIDDFSGHYLGLHEDTGA